MLWSARALVQLNFLLAASQRYREVSTSTLLAGTPPYNSRQRKMRRASSPGCCLGSRCIRPDLHAPDWRQPRTATRWAAVIRLRADVQRGVLMGSALHGSEPLRTASWPLARRSHLFCSGPLWLVPKMW